MEGPSLHLAAEQLAPFKGQRIRSVSGNTSLGTARFEGQVVKDLFAWGKHLVFQFDDFALRVHFLLFGTFTAEVDGSSVTGDYEKAGAPRLAFTFGNGTVRMYACSLKFIESPTAKRTYDHSIDIMSRAWDPAGALKSVTARPDAEISDVLLDQEVFAGVGNIIKNEVLSLTRVHPRTKVRDLTARKLKEIIATARSFSRQFFRWRKAFVLRKNLLIHGRKACPHCGGRVTKELTGMRQRMAHYCPACQQLKA